MNPFLILNFFTTITNTLFRNIPDFVRYILIFAFMGLGVWCLALSIKKKDDKSPINYSRLILAVVFVALAMCYIFIK